MTGHDLDLDAWERRCTAAEKRATGRAVTRAEVRADSREIRALLAEVESLRAKLAAAEQERDRLRRWRIDGTIALGRASVAEAALAAVRELVEREKRERGGRATPWTFVAELEAALAAAEQPQDGKSPTNYASFHSDPSSSMAAAGQPEPERAVGRCVSRGPRISGEGRPICALPAGHAGWHRGDESWTYGGMSAPEWGDLTGKPEPTPEQP